MPTRTLADLMSSSRSQRGSSSIYEPPDFSSGTSSFVSVMSKLAQAQLAQQKAAQAAAARAAVPSSDGGFIDGGTGPNPPTNIRLPKGWKWLQTEAGHWYGAYDRGSAGMKELAKVKGEQDRALAVEKITEKHPDLKKDIEALPSMSVEKQAKTLEALRKQASQFDPAEAQMILREVLEPAAKQNAKERAAVESDSGLGTVWDYLKMGGIKALNAGKLMMPRSTESKMALADSYNKDIQSIMDNNAYIRNQEKLKAEGNDWFDRTGAETGGVFSNIAAPIAEMGTDIGTILGAGAAGSAAGSLVPGIGTAMGGLGGAAAGLLARGTAAYNAGRLEFLSRVMADDRLSDEQKKQAIDGYGEYGEGALNAAIWTALPGAKLPGQVARSTERAAVRELPKVTTDYVTRSGALQSTMPDTLKAAMDWNAKSLASRYARSVAKTGLELEAYNTAGLLGGNAIYNAATGQNDPITEGLGDSLLSTAGSALLFGIPGARRHPLTVNKGGIKPKAAETSTTDRTELNKTLMSTEAQKEAAGITESTAPADRYTKDARERLNLLHDNLKGASAEHLKEGSTDRTAYSEAVFDAVESFYAAGGTDAELEDFIKSAGLAKGNKANSHASKSQFPKKQLEYVQSAMNNHKVLAATMNQNAEASAIDPKMAAAATDALNGKAPEATPSALKTEAAEPKAEAGKTAETTPSAIKEEPAKAASTPNELFWTSEEFAKRGWTDRSLAFAEGMGIVRPRGGGKDGYFLNVDAYNKYRAEQAAKKGSTADAEDAYVRAGRKFVTDSIDVKPVDRRKAVEYAQMLVQDGKAVEADNFIKGFNDENQINGIEVLPVAPFEYRDDLGNPIGGSSAKVSSKEGQAGRVAGEGQNAPVEEPVAAAEGKSDTRNSDVNRGVEADGAQAAGAPAEAAPVQTAGSNTGNQGERAGGAAVQSGGQNQGAEAQAGGTGSPAVGQRSDAGSGAEPAAGTDAAAGESARSDAGEGVGAQRGTGDAQDAGGNPVEYTWNGTSLVFPENAVSSTATPAEAAEKRAHSIATAEATSELLSYIQTLQGDKSIRKDKAEFLEIRDMLQKLSTGADFKFDRGRAKNALAYVNRVISAKLAAEAKAAKLAAAMEQASSDDAMQAAIAAGAKNQGNAAVVMDAAATKAAVEHAEAVQERTNVILGDNALNEPEKLDATIKTLSESKFEENSVEEDARRQALDLALDRKDDITAAARNGIADTVFENNNDGQPAVTRMASNSLPENMRVSNADVKVREKKVETPEATTDKIVSDASMEAIDTLTRNIDALPHLKDNISSSDIKMAEGWLKQVDDLVKSEHHSPESAYDRILRSYVLPMFETALKNPKDMGVLFGTNPTAMARTWYLRGLMDRIDRIAMNSKALKFSSEYLAEAMAKHEKNVAKYYKTRAKNVAALEKAEEEASKTSSTITMADIRNLFKSFGTEQTESKTPKNAAAKQLADQAILEERRSNRTEPEESSRLSAEEIKTLRPEEGTNRNRTYADENDTGIALESSMTLDRATDFAEASLDLGQDEVPEEGWVSYQRKLKREARSQGVKLDEDENGNTVRMPRDPREGRIVQDVADIEADRDEVHAQVEARLKRAEREAYEAETARIEEQLKSGDIDDTESPVEGISTGTFTSDDPITIMRNGQDAWKRIKDMYTEMTPTKKHEGVPEFVEFQKANKLDKRHRADALFAYLQDNPTDPRYDELVNSVRSLGTSIRGMMDVLHEGRDEVLNKFFGFTKDTTLGKYNKGTLSLLQKAIDGEPITPEEIKKARELCTAK